MCIKVGSTYYNLLNESGDDAYLKGQRQEVFVRGARLSEGRGLFVCVQGAKPEAWQGVGGTGGGPSGLAQRSAAS